MSLLSARRSLWPILGIRASWNRLSDADYCLKWLRFDCFCQICTIDCAAANPNLILLLTLFIPGALIARGSKEKKLAGWGLDDIDWHLFDASRVRPEFVALAKAASLVESNAADYRDYLCNVFADDTRVCRSVEVWAEEERRHGAALARWAHYADPGFDFDRAFQVFLDGYRIPVAANASVRGSRTGEMIARCMVETGTNSFYSALAEASDEPVFRQICQLIADDEMAHYWLFHNHLKRYVERDRLTFLQRLKVALGRIVETEDDELAYAYYAANNMGEPYDRRRHGGTYHRQALAFYSPRIVEKAIGMVFATLGLRADTLTGRGAAALASGALGLRRRFLGSRLAG